MNVSKMENFILGDIHIMLPFYLILTRGPIVIVKNKLIKGDFLLMDAFKVAFRCMFY